MNKLIITLTAVFFLMAATVSFAGEMAFVDLGKTLEISNKGKDLQKKLAGLKDGMEIEMRQKEMELKKLRDEIEAQKDVLSEEALNEKAQQFYGMQMALQKKGYQLEMSLQESRIKLTQSFIKDIEAVSGQIAKERGYKIVILNSMDFMTYSPVLLYGDPSVDITDDVVKRLNENG